MVLQVEDAVYHCFDLAVTLTAVIAAACGFPLESWRNFRVPRSKRAHPKKIIICYNHLKYETPFPLVNIVL